MALGDLAGVRYYSTSGCSASEVATSESRNAPDATSLPPDARARSVPYRFAKSMIILW